MGKKGANIQIDLDLLSELGPSWASQTRHMIMQQLQTKKYPCYLSPHQEHGECYK
jgi:hypothetical protein